MCYATEVRVARDIVETFRQRQADLKLSNELLERFAGLATGHLSKIFPENPTKQIGLPTLILLLGGLGLKILLIEDPEKTKQLLSRSDYEPRKDEYDTTFKKKIPQHVPPVVPAKSSYRKIGQGGENFRPVHQSRRGRPWDPAKASANG